MRPPKLTLRARLKASAELALVMLSDPRKLRALYLRSMSHAFDGHMRSAAFLYCMRRGLSAIVAAQLMQHAGELRHGNRASRS